MSNIELSNFTGAVQGPGALFYYVSSIDSMFTVRSIDAHDSNFRRTPLLTVETPINLVTFENISICNSEVGESTSLLTLKNIESLQFSTGIFQNLTVSDIVDEDSSILDILVYDLRDTMNSSITDINVSASQISFFKVGVLLNEAISPKEFIFRDMNFNDMVIPNSRSLIDTSGFAGNGDFKISFSNLSFERVNFMRNGNILKFGHKLDNEVVVSGF